MTDAQKRLRDLRDRQSKERGKMAELAQLDTLSDEQRGELDTIEAGTADLERLIRAATTAVEEEDRSAKAEGAKAGTEPDGEDKERLELRGRASVGRYLSAALRGRAPDGAEAELAAAAGVDGIPMELWQYPEERRDEDRAITEAPGTVGINLDTLRPAVFAPSIASKLMLDMPIVQSGTYASGTITQEATAAAVKKQGAVPATAAGFTVTTTTPHRIGTGLDLTLEDLAAVGQENFESVLRQHVSLKLADVIDDQLINGDGSTAGTANNLHGFFSRLTDPTGTAPATVAGFDDFVSVFSDGIDGLWSTMVSEVAIVVGTDSYRLAAKTFRDRIIDTGQRGGVSLGDISFADYARERTAGFATNKRMPATDSNIQQAILCRKGRSMSPSPMRTAVAPVWYGSVSIDDIYTGARKGERYFTLSVLLGDVILVQPDAYEQVRWRVST